MERKGGRIKPSWRSYGKMQFNSHQKDEDSTKFGKVLLNEMIYALTRYWVIVKAYYIAKNYGVSLNYFVSVISKIIV